ncbi:hypothetical protein C0993_009752 [Termitomyces sp. T159_Od127]|nr:hypothetical protein C0993_009752 [Termitomyces sp. T159_Od127]
MAPQAPDEPRTRIVQDDDADSEWEEIEAIPDSPLYPLPNDGMDPLAAFPLPTRSQRQSTRTIDSDLDAGIMHHAVRHKFAFALPQGLFRRPSIQRNHSLSLQRRRSSSSLFPISTSEKTLVKSSKSSSTPRKLSRVKITKGKRIRSRSDSLPPSPFVLLTSPRDNDVDPAMPTTQIVSSCETPPRPASGSAIEAQTSCSMGYHHQFFIQAQEEAFRASLK